MKKYSKPKGELSYKWKGGRRINHNGYIEVFKPNYHRARGNGYVFEHIVVIEEKIGRILLPSETVHHVDGNKQNNNPDNLIAETRNDHSRKYPSKKRNGAYLKCVICGKEFYEKPSHIAERKACSRKCSGVYFKQLYTGKTQDHKPRERKIVNEQNYTYWQTDTRSRIKI